MHAGVGPEGQLAEVAFFHLDEKFFILGAEPFEHGRVHHDAQLEIRLVALALF